MFRSATLSHLLIAAGMAFVLVMPSHLHAQSATMPRIGEISGGNAVLLEQRTVKRSGDEVTATLRTVFTKPAKAKLTW